MHNIFRFLLGLGIFLLLLIIVGLLLLLFSPLIIGGSVLFAIMAALATIIFLVVGFFVFIWHMSKKEPEIKDKDYSIKQGKDV